MRYTRPQLGEHTLAYRGRRYWIIKIAPGDQFEYVDNTMGDYVLWDCLYGGVLAIIKDCEDGSYVGSIMSHVDLGEAGFGSLKEATSDLASEYESYAKHCFG